MCNSMMMRRQAPTLRLPQPGPARGGGAGVAHGGDGSLLADAVAGADAGLSRQRVARHAHNSAAAMVRRTSCYKIAWRLTLILRGLSARFFINVGLYGTHGTRFTKWLQL